MANKTNTAIEISEVTTPVNPPSGVQKIYPKVDGFVYSKNSAGTEYQLRNPITWINLATNQTSTTTIRVNTTGFTFNVVAGKVYRFEYIGLFQTVSLTTGASFGVVLGSGAGTISGYWEVTISQATVATALRTPIRAISTVNTLAGSFITSTSVSVVNSPHSVKGDMVFICTTSGTINFQFASEVNLSTATLLAGTSLIVTQLN